MDSVELPGVYQDIASEGGRTGEALAQLRFEQFAGGIAGQRIDQLEKLGDFVAREMLAAIGPQRETPLAIVVPAPQ